MLTKRFCMAKCVLYDRECIECGECNICDINPDKVCDNCGKCQQSHNGYLAILAHTVRCNQTNRRQQTNEQR